MYIFFYVKHVYMIYTFYRARVRIDLIQMLHSKAADWFWRRKVMEWSKISPTELFLAAMQVGFECTNCAKCCQKMQGIAYNSVDCHRMARQLKMGVKEFVTTFTRQSDRKASDRWINLVGEEQKCPFLGDKGCTQYEGRGQVCRAYPWFVVASRKDVCAGKPFRLYPQCKGMILSFLKVLRRAQAMDFKEAENLVKLPIGRFCWLYMLADEGKEGTAQKVASEMGLANLPVREAMVEAARDYAAAYMALGGKRKLENMIAEVEGYAANSGH
jgi:Fe-S-cluster containining protein